MGRSPWLCAFAAIFGSGLALAASFPTPEETRREFEAVCARLQRDNLYFGRAVVDWVEERLADPGIDAERRIELHGQLAYELLRLGRIEEGIGKLRLGLKLAEDAGLGPTDDRRHRMLGFLAFAHLQLGEDRNCVERHNAASCILPIAPEAVHAVPEPARIAGDLFLEALRARPDDIQSRWLLNIARMVSGDYPQGVPEGLRLPPDALPAVPSFPTWRNVAPELGIAAVDLSGGAVTEDFDGDGLLDLISSSSDPCEPLKAFRNDGRGGFEEVTAAWGLDGQLGGLNLAHADFDNDGRPDVLVLRGGWFGEDGRIRNSLLRNDLARQSASFVDVTATAGLAFPAYPTQTAAWADYDGDGDLDLYVGNEAAEGTADPTRFRFRGRSYPSQLFRNNGDGTFTDVARQAGVVNHRFTKGVAWGDFDDDGDPDLYVSAFGENRLYRNAGDGTFADVAGELGVTGPQASFPTWFFDFDNDGDLDLFAAEYAAPPALVSASYIEGRRGIGNPRLYRNEGGSFTEASVELGVSRPALPMGSNYGDLDNDGWLDFYLGTGEPLFLALMPNQMYRNVEGGAFEDVTFGGGFGHLQKGHGVAFADLDNDGDQDLFEQMGGAFPFDAYGNALYENPGNDNSWIVLRLEGRKANRFGVGARIAVRVRSGDSTRTIHVLAGTGGSFGSSSLQQEIGLGDAEVIDSLSITWPGSGTRDLFIAIEPNRFYRAVEGAASLVPLEVPRIRLRANATAPAHHHPDAE